MEGKPNPKTKGTFKPSPLKEGKTRAFRRAFAALKGLKLTDFLSSEVLPSKHGGGRSGDPYKKKYKAWRKMRRKMANASRKRNRR